MDNLIPGTEEYYKYFNNLKMEYQSCDTCMNDMELIRSNKGNYWICRICNSIKPSF